MRFSTIITITASCCVASVRSASVEDGEFKNITIWNDSTTHIINDEATSFNHETIVVKDNTRLRIEANGYITAPINGYKSDTDWPAVQLSIGSVFIAKGGSITGPSATMEGTHGGEGIEVYNGQSGPETASVAYFDDGVSVAGGDAVDGVGGNALHVHGFGTEAFLYGGNFRGGKGSNNDNGLSINVLLGGAVHIHSGTFDGGIEVGDSSTITFYGCFLQNGTIVSGEFADETTLSVNVRTRNGGEIALVSVAEQECETAPSMSPTNFPTLSPQPTVPRPNAAGKVDVTYYGWIVAVIALVQFAGGE